MEQIPDTPSLTIPSLLEGLPRESMLTYAVLLGQQKRKNDRYALGAQITDMAIKGYLSIRESEHPEHNPTLGVNLGEDMLEEEAVFAKLLRQNCAPDDHEHTTLNAILNDKKFSQGVPVLWERVVLMHRTDHNKHRPLYVTDPTRLARWQRFKATLGWVSGVVSVFAEPGWQGPVAGLSDVQKGYEASELLGLTKQGKRLHHQIINLRKQMLRLTESGKSDDDSIAAYERALPFAFLIDDALKEKWPAFLSQRYEQYPSWLEPSQPIQDKAGRQAHIASMLRVMGRLCFPDRKRRAHPA